MQVLYHMFCRPPLAIFSLCVRVRIRWALPTADAHDRHFSPKSTQLRAGPHVPGHCCRSSAAAPRVGAGAETLLQSPLTSAASSSCACSRAGRHPSPSSREPLVLDRMLYRWAWQDWQRERGAMERGVGFPFTRCPGGDREKFAVLRGAWHRGRRLHTTNDGPTVQRL